MSEQPDLHPDTGEPTRLVSGRIQMTHAELHPSLRMGRSAGYAKGVGVVDLKYAQDIASRRVGPAADAEIGKAVSRLLDAGKLNAEDIAAIAKSIREIEALSMGVLSGAPSPLAMEVARRLSSVAVLQGATTPEAMELVIMAYAALQLDETRMVIGGAS